MKKIKGICAILLALLIGMQPMLISAANEEIMPAENEFAAQTKNASAEEAPIEEETIKEEPVEEEPVREELTREEFSEEAAATEVISEGGQEAGGGSVSQEIVRLSEAEDEEPRAGGTAVSNVSYSPVTGNASVTSLPAEVFDCVKGDVVWFNLHVTNDVEITRATLTIYKNGSYYDSYTRVPELSYFRYVGYSCQLSDYGKYTYRWVVSSRGNNDVELPGYVNVPEVTLSASDFTLDLFGTKSRTFNCSVNYMDAVRELAWDKNSGCVSCSWGGWSGNAVPLTITANSVGTTPITVYLKRTSDGKVFDKKTIYVTVRDSTPKYTVYFNANGGSVSPTSKTVTYGGAYGDLPTPTRSGYSFAGWYTSAEGGTKIASDSSIWTSASHTLYAHWTGRTYTVYFDANGGSVSPTSKTVTYGGAYGALPTPTRSNYNFAGWYTSRTGGTKVTSDSRAEITASQTLYARWTGRTHTVFFDANGGEVAPASKEAVYGNEYGPLPTPYWTGYDFAGWYTSRTGGTKVTEASMVQNASSHTLYAHWTGRTYTVYFNPCDGSVSPTSKTVTYGGAYGTLPVPTRAGYYFDGWHTSYEGGMKITGSSLIWTTASHTLYAHWTKEAQTYTVRFDANGGSVSPMAKTVTNGEKYGDLPVPTRADYEFAGWHTSKTGGAKVTSASTVELAADQTLYAHWTKEARTYTVRFDANGGSVSPTAKTVTNGEKYGDLPTPEWEGHEFAGWHTSKTGGTEITSDDVAELTSDQTLYAHWTDLSQRGYLIYFDANGGEVAILSKTVVYDSIYGDLPTPEWEGHEFAGWHTARSGGTKITNVSRVQMTASHTLYAHWGEDSRKKYTVTFNANGGRVSPTSKTAVYGEPYGALPTPTRTEYAFDGWYTARSEGTRITSESLVELTKDQTLYAHWTWKIVPPTVTTKKAADIKKNAATLAGSVDDDGGDGKLTRQFVYWNKYEPLSRYTVNAGADFKAALKNLAPSSTYFYYAKALNKAGEGLGNVLSLTTTAEETPVSITVSPTYLSMEKGDTHQLMATVLPATAANRKVLWSSSDAGVVKVDGSGKLEAKKAGRAVITATAQANSRLTAACTVEVSKEPLPDIKGAFDFSEWNMASNAARGVPDGFDFAEGGNYQMSTAYLARWDGAVLEEKDPYPSYPNGVYREVDADYHVQEILWLPERESWSDNSEIKAAIMNYGAAYESFLVNNSCFDRAKKNYYAPESTSSFSGGHAIAVVGWDDNYSKNNFTKTPPGNGAFICKNSWGTNSGENGYFYISYYDKYIGKRGGGAVVPSIEHKTNYNTIYQYDPLGVCSAVGYNNATFAANVFPQKGSALKKDEALRAVSFYTRDKNTSYEVYVVKDYKNSASLSAKGTAVASGSIKDMGYHTVPLNESVLLKAGTRFAVIVKLSVSSGTSWMCMEYPMQGYSSGARANADESYYSSNGTKWNDLTGYTKNANCCIKAFTDNGMAAYSPQLFEGIEEQARAYEDDKVYTVEEALQAGIPVSEDFVEWIREPRAGSGEESEDSSLGNIPVIFDVGGNTVSFVEGAILPAKYDLRKENSVTGVRNQGSYGSCWTFATYASLESCLAKKAKSLSSIQAAGGSIMDALADVAQGGVPLTGLELSDAEIRMRVNETYNLTAAFEPVNTTDNIVIWSSSDESVATVDTNGMVTAHGGGTAVISATTLSGVISAECAVIVSQSVENADITKIKDAYTYTGKKLTPAPVVKLAGQTLKKNVDYTTAYKNNKNVGTATLTVKGKGDYAGTKKITFKINPKGTALYKLTAGKKRIAVKWKKQAVQTTGYEIQYSTGKKFAKGATKLVPVKKASIVSTTLTKLKAKKRYYVRIRTYKTVSGKKHYSGWSKAMNIKTK